VAVASGQLDGAVIVAMIAVGMMQVPLDQKVDVVAMRDGLVPAAGAVLVAALDVRRAAGRIRRADRDRMLVDVIAVHVMQVAVVQIVDMTLVADRRVPAARAMLVRVVGVMLLCASGHD
jgi:hypothetical protein